MTDKTTDHATQLREIAGEMAAMASNSPVWRRRCDILRAAADELDRMRWPSIAEAFAEFRKRIADESASNRRSETDA